MFYSDVRWRLDVILQQKCFCVDSNKYFSQKGTKDTIENHKVALERGKRQSAKVECPLIGTKRLVDEETFFKDTVAQAKNKRVPCTYETTQK